MTFSGGIATVMVSDMDRAVRFYTETLGLKLSFRAEDEWAEVTAGPGLTIGLHPAGEHGPRPGAGGAISLGFNVDGPIQQSVDALTARGVVFRGPVVANPDEPVKLAFFGDPDGNPLYLCETVRT